MLLLMHQSFIPSKLLPVFLLSQKFNHFLSVIAVSGRNLLKILNMKSIILRYYDFRCE